MSDLIQKLYQDIETGRCRGELALIADIHGMPSRERTERLATYLKEREVTAVVGLGDWNYNPTPYDTLNFNENQPVMCGLIGRETICGQHEKITSNITITHGWPESLADEVQVSGRERPYLVITGHEHRQYLQERNGERINGNVQSKPLEPGRLYIINPGTFDRGELGILEIDGNDYRITLDKLGDGK